MRSVLLTLIFTTFLIGCSDKAALAPTPEGSDPSAFVGCSKDTDCKGDRVCDNNVCAAPSVAQSVVPSTAGGVAASVRALEDQLRCASNPEPGKALLALIANGLITEPTEFGDGVPTLLPRGELKVFGHNVVSVHGFEEDPKGRAKDLFPRGPGTSPGHFISIVLDAQPSSVDYKPVQYPDDSWAGSTISEAPDGPGRTEIECRGRGV